MDKEFNLKEWTYDLICILERRCISYHINHIDYLDSLYFRIDNTGIDIMIMDTILDYHIQIENLWHAYDEDKFIYLKDLKELDDWLETQKWGRKH